MKLVLIIEDDGKDGEVDLFASTVRGSDYNPSAIEFIEALEVIRKTMYSQFLNYAIESKIATSGLEEDFTKLARRIKLSDLNIISTAQPVSVQPNEA